MVGAHAFRRAATAAMPPGLRQEIARRVLGAEPRLDRVAVKRMSYCFRVKRLARRDAKLPFDQIDPGDRFGHRMLDLQPRVHFHEIEVPAGIEQEFDRAGAVVADRLASATAAAPIFVAQLRRSTAGEGLSSISFWCRRCTEQSRSPRWITLPCWSAKTCTSMWRALDDRALQHQAPVAERVLAPPSARRIERGGKLASASATSRMPRPPPPAAALIITGKPMLRGLRRKPALL